MQVKFILPALTEATSPLFRPIKYSLFPPLGLATLAGYLNPDDEASITDEHVERVRLEARKRGHTFTEQSLSDGSIKVSIQVGGAA